MLEADDLGAADAPGWMADALCAEPHYRPEVWFPSVEQARAVCGRCLVRRECLGWALAEGIADGVLGGATWQERDALARAGVTAELVGRYGSWAVGGLELERERALDAAFGELRAAAVSAVLGALSDDEPHGAEMGA